MKTKFLYSTILLVVSLGLFLGFKTSEDIYGARSNNANVTPYTPNQYVTDNVPVYTDDFDGDNTNTGLQARGYKCFNVSVPVGSTNWSQGSTLTFNAFNGPATGYVSANYNNTGSIGNIDNWMILPRIVGGIQATDSLAFWSRSANDAATNYPDSVRIMYSANGDSTVAGTWVDVGRYRVVNPVAGAPNGGWERRAWKAPSAGANGRFAIRYCVVNGGLNGANSNYIGIDALRIERTAAPPPPNPTNWYTQTATGVTTQLYSVSAPDINNVWACGAGGKVIRATNGGTFANANGNLAASDLYSIYAFDANTALTTNAPAASNVFRTTNAGVNWTQVFTQPGGFINGWYFKDANNGIMMGDAVGGRWSLWRTTNGGVNWDSAGMFVASTEASWTCSISGIGDNVWFGTNATKVYKSTNFGSNWTSAPTTGEVNGYSNWFNSATNGFSGGTTMQVTTNGGTSWAANTIPGTGTIQGLCGWVGTNTWFAGRSNIVYQTTNTGATWTTAYTATATGQIWNMTVARTGSPYVYGCSSTGWIVKYGGLVLGTTPVSGIADNYSLSQNYPNPFNPTTNIKFAIPQSGLVTLKIYNMLGKEVATLVNGSMSAGSYNYDFNASNLSSGIYFYKLEAGNFVETKKMMLVK